MHQIQAVPWNSEPLCCCCWIRADGHWSSICAAQKLDRVLILYLLVLSDQELVSLKQCWLVQIRAMLRAGSGWCKAGTVLNKQDCADWEGKDHCHEVAIPVLQGAPGIRSGGMIK